MNSTDTLQVRVKAITYEAEGILSFELVPLPPRQTLPVFTAGAHIDLHLQNGLIRSYSLLNKPGEQHRYQIGVNKDAHSRGGSRYVHEALRAGSVLSISAPRNNFPLDDSAPHQVFIAGGIGVTPMLGMIEQCIAVGRTWTLFYSARTRESASFLDKLLSFSEKSGGKLVLNFDQEPGGKLLDLDAIVKALPTDASAEAHIYCCGPLPMLEAFEKATASLPPHRVHREYFAAKEAAAKDGGYTVELARSGRSVTVLAGHSILDSLLAIGIDPPYSCGEGICGTCEVKVLAGTPDHRDLVLSSEEHAANDRMMICCSGAKSDKLVLDL